MYAFFLFNKCTYLKSEFKNCELRTSSNSTSHKGQNTHNKCIAFKYNNTYINSQYVQLNNFEPSFDVIYVSILGLLECKIQNFDYILGSVSHNYCTFSEISNTPILSNINHFSIPEPQSKKNQNCLKTRNRKTDALKPIFTPLINNLALVHFPCI